MVEDGGSCRGIGKDQIRRPELIALIAEIPLSS